MTGIAIVCIYLMYIRTTSFIKNKETNNGHLGTLSDQCVNRCLQLYYPNREAVDKCIRYCTT